MKQVADPWRLYGLTWQQCQSILLALGVFLVIVASQYLFRATPNPDHKAEPDEIHNPHPGVLIPVRRRRNVLFDWLEKEAKSRARARELTAALRQLDQEGDKEKDE